MLSSILAEPKTYDISCKTDTHTQEISLSGDDEEETIEIQRTMNKHCK